MANDLIVTVYLNQRLVFDLVAASQGGIATVTRLERSSNESSSHTEKSESGFKLSDAFSSLLKISLSGQRSKKNDSSDVSNYSEERTHTPSSLFSELRLNMHDKGLVVDPTKGLPKPGDFVEFTAKMRLNPMIEAIDAMKELTHLFEAMAPGSMKQPSTSSSGNKSNNKGADKSPIGIVGRLSHFSDFLKQGPTKDVLASIPNMEIRSVVTLEEKFLNDSSMSDLIDGTFRVFGKVTNSVHEKTEGISLIRRTPANIAPDMIKQLANAFDKNSENHPIMKTPKMEIEISGPAFQVIPIAIFA